MRNIHLNWWNGSVKRKLRQSYMDIMHSYKANAARFSENGQLVQLFLLEHISYSQTNNLHPHILTDLSPGLFSQQRGMNSWWSAVTIPRSVFVCGSVYLCSSSSPPSVHSRPVTARLSLRNPADLLMNSRLFQHFFYSLFLGPQLASTQLTTFFIAYFCFGSISFSKAHILDHFWWHLRNWIFATLAMLVFECGWGLVTVVVLQLSGRC